MPKSDFAKHLDAVQEHVAAFLKPLGFRKKGRTHNRITEAGLVQIINFQMGEYPIGEHYVIPGIRESFYGRFAVNLGVLMPCVYEAVWQKPVPAFAQEYSSTIRDRLGTLAFGADNWFDLTSGVSTTAETLVLLFDRYGLPFLEQFSNYQSVLAYYESHGNLPSQNSGRAAFEAAIIFHFLEDSYGSHRLFTEARSASHQGFREYVTTIASRLGYHVA